MAADAVQPQNSIHTDHHAENKCTAGFRYADIDANINSFQSHSTLIYFTMFIQSLEIIVKR